MVPFSRYRTLRDWSLSSDIYYNIAWFNAPLQFSHLKQCNKEPKKEGTHMKRNTCVFSGYYISTFGCFPRPLNKPGGSTLKLPT